MRERLLHGWNFARLLRLGLALAFLGAAWNNGEWIAYALAALFGLQAVLNTGCCGSACATPPANRKSNAVVEDVHYEEVR